MRLLQQEYFIRFRRKYILLLLLFLSPILLSAQESDCGCYDNINILLDDQCTFQLTLENVQAGTCADGAYLVVNDSNPGNGSIIDCPGEFEYGIFRNEELVCWGLVTAEDKLGPNIVDTITRHPTLECYLAERFVNDPATIDPDNKYYLGEILFRDNCSDCGCLVNRTFSDQLLYKSCEETLENGIYAELVRTWTAVDCRGQRTEANQIFTFVRPLLDTLNLVTDTTYQTCTPESTVILTRHPYWIDSFGDRVELDEMDCNYAVTIEQAEFPVCSDGSYKQENYVRVFDWCGGGARYVDTFLVKVGDFAGPRFTGNAQPIADGVTLDQLRSQVDRDSLYRLLTANKINTVPTGPIDCTAALSLQLQTLQYLLGFGLEDCSMPRINVDLFSYQPEARFGFPVGDSTWVETQYGRFLDVVSNIPVGIHALQLTAEDECKNVSRGLVFFMVEDQIAPIMKCTDELHVSLTSGHPDAIDREAYARLDAVDIDEGSVDNCALGQLKIRRSVTDLDACQSFFLNKGYDANQDGLIDEQDWFDENENGIFDLETEFKWELKNDVWYTPWRDFVEFSCCDLDQAVTIELGGWDNARHPLTGAWQRNLNYCWQTTIIEDSTLPSILPLPNVEIACTDDLLGKLRDGVLEGDLLEEVRTAFGTAQSVGIFCGTIQMRETLNDQRDQCGFGKIERIIEVEKMTGIKGTKVTTITQDLYIQQVFDYSLCFPADVSYDCVDGLGEIPSVITESTGCDLFATNITDDPFNAIGDPDACYKIFRTYRIVNWCEYDGFSPPVIVSRDWDDWNGCDVTTAANLPVVTEYNINPLAPDGDGLPGDEGICVIVKRDFSDDQRDVVYYDRNNDPFDQIPDQPSTLNTIEGYWWKVVSGDPNPNSSQYGSGGYLCGDIGVWNNDRNQNGALDDDDYQYGSNGFWQYTQHIKVLDDVPPTLSIVGADTFRTTNNFDCEANFSLQIAGADNCTESLQYKVYLDRGNSGFNFRDYTTNLVDGVLSGQLGLGTHRFIVEVRDVCGNLSTQERLLTIVDGLAPSPICLSGIIVELMPSRTVRGATAVWATDFITSPIGDCTGQGPELVEVGSGVQQAVIKDYSINRIGEPAHRDSTGVYLTCDDLGDLVPVEVHAWDEAGNHGFCTTFIEAQDNQGLCSINGGGRIAGGISTEQNHQVEGVEIQLSGARRLSRESNALGAFFFGNLVEGGDYTLRPEKNEDAKNGVSTLDLVLMSRHILGTQLLDSPFKMIAADVNRSGTITTFDLIQLRKLILNIETDFTGNTSWRFVDASYQFPNPTNPWLETFPEVKNINNLAGAPLVDFIAIKVGDLNYSATMNSAQMPASRTTAGTLSLTTQDLSLVAGETYLIHFYSNLQDISGLQFTLEADPSNLELVDVETAFLEPGAFGWFEEEATLTAAQWIEEPIEKTIPLFGLRFKAKKTGRLSENLRLTSAYTNSEAYNQMGEPLAVAIDFGNDLLIADQDHLQQNFPNPFRSQTTIGFYLVEAGPIQLSIQDVQGRILKSYDGHFEQGYHQVQVAKADLPTSGWYSYELKTERKTVSKALVLLE